MQLLTHAPTGPWPELGACPCCGQPWPHRPYVPIGPFEPFEPIDLVPEIPTYEPPTPGPWSVEPEIEIVPDFVLLSGVSLEFLVWLAGELGPL